MNKKISVLMGAYNCAGTIGQAIEAIQNQTYSNWELIICDDGSTDATAETVMRYVHDDPRIVVLHNLTNHGLNQTLNRCFAVSTGDYIARMDGDDDCLPKRLKKQVRFLEEHPEYAIVSSAMTLFDEGGEWGVQRTPEYPTPEQVVAGTAICHAPVMMRRECLEMAHGYSTDPKTLRVEDVDLWIRLYTAGYRAYNIQEPLYRMRNDQNALNRRKYRYRVNSTRVRLKGCRSLHLGFKSYLRAFKPMVNGLVPGWIRQMIKKRRKS